MLKIEDKYKVLINKAIDYMSNISDFEHDINHVMDVVDYTYKLLGKVDGVDKDVCIISAYWHDVGRIKINEGHEKLSADMLRDEMVKLKYGELFIDKCCKAIEKHKWNMLPETKEGLIIRDADKLAFLGIRRWKNCIEHNKRLDEIVNLLPKLRNEILYFNESRKLYDESIIELLKLLYF